MYNKLFEPGYIGKLRLKNRTVMPAIGTSMATSTGEASDEIIGYYEARAKGGCGLIITEITRIDEETGKGEINQLSATEPYQVPRLEKLTRTVHRYGAKIFIQLHHPGRQCHSRVIGGRQIVAPSAITCKTINEEPRALETEEIEAMVKNFIKGAKIAQMGNVDGVEIHSAHGYLLGQFLSPHTNRRTDKYGGNFENRHRMLTEIIVGIKYICGKDFPICVRIDGDEFVEGGISLKESVKTARYLESIGVDAINVSAGTYETANTIIEPYSYKEGWKKHLSKAIKEAIKIPVIAVNTIKTPNFAEKMLEEEFCDFVGLGRAQLADSSFVEKARNNKAEDIRPCIGCLHCIETLMSGYTMKCAVNPMVGYEREYQNIEKNGEGKKVVVVGGGPSGLQAAITLAQREFDVVLFEKQDYLGGAAYVGSIPPHKKLLLTLINSLELEAKKMGVEIKLSHAPTLDEIKAINPYAIYLAMGGDEIQIPLSDSGKDSVLTGMQVLREETTIKNKKIAVIGSGMTGLETAEFLSQKGNDVTVVEMLKEIGPGIHPALLIDIKTRLDKIGIKMLPYHKLVDYKNNNVMLIDNQTMNIINVQADYCVLCIGTANKLKDKTLLSIEKEFENVFVIGDSEKPGRIYEAVATGFDKAYALEGGV